MTSARFVWCVVLAICSAIVGSAWGEPSSGSPRTAASAADPFATAAKHTIVKAAGEFQRCYRSYLQQGGAKTTETLTVDWRVTPEGKPTKTELVSSSIAPSRAKAPFETCVVRQVAALDFPPTERTAPHYMFHTFRFTDVESANRAPTSAVPR